MSVPECTLSACLFFGSMTDVTLLALAEDTAVYIPLRPGFAPPTLTDRYGFFPGPRVATVQRIRLEDDAVEPAADEIRARARAADLRRIVWWVGDAATPDDLGERLGSLGFAPMATLTSMALVTAPSGVPAAEVREVATLDEWLRANEIDQVVAEISDDEASEMQAFNVRVWPEVQKRRVPRMYLAYLDDEPVGFARTAFTDAGVALLGAGTLPPARRRGVYTSLVHARWRHAVEASTPALVTQAGDMSEPILRRLGFKELGKIRLFGGE
jgi:hypothetical protein